MGNGAIVYMGYGVQGVWAMGHMGNGGTGGMGHMGNRGTWAIGSQRVWGTRGMGNGVQGYGVYRQWGTGAWAT